MPNFTNLEGRAVSQGSYKHLDTADVPWVGGWGSAGASVRVRSCVLSDGKAHDLAASLYCHSMHSSHSGRRSSRGRMRRVGAHRSVGRALPIRSVAGRARYRQRGDGTARGSGPGEDAVPRRPWDAAAVSFSEQLDQQEARRRIDGNGDVAAIARGGWSDLRRTRRRKHPPQGAKALKCACFEMC